jgi:hypothetical protein
MIACTRRRYPVDARDGSRAGPHACWSAKVVGRTVYPVDITRTVRCTGTARAPFVGFGRSRRMSLIRFVKTRTPEF